MGDVFGLAGPADRGLVGPGSDELVPIGPQSLGGRLGHVGGDEARCHAVGGYPELAELDRYRLGEACRPAFAAE